MTELKKKAANGFLWSSIDRILTQGVTFVLGVIVARMLTPDVYGLIAMIMVFLSISNTFVDCGLSSALIRKTDRTGVDESTVFYTNVGIGVFFYLLLYWCAPFIAAFYEQPILTSVMRCVGLTLIFNSFSVIQQTILVAKIDFKTQTKISLAFNILSGGAGITFAYLGWGIWALVIQAISAAFFRSLFLWFWVRWRPSRQFSMNSFKELFAFGSRLLASGLLNTGYNNIYLMLVGKYYNAGSLGYYTRATQFANLPSTNLSEVIQRVSYPVLSMVQNDAEHLRTGYRKILTFAAFITFPVMIWLAVAAKPLVIVLLTDKWMEAGRLLPIICLALMWYPIHAINLNLLQVKGRSELFLKLEVVKKVISVSVLLVTLPMGLTAMCWGQVSTSLIALAINTFYTGKLIQMGFFAQMKDFLPIMLRAILAGIIALLFVRNIENDYMNVILSFIAGALAYLLLSLPTCRALWKEGHEIFNKKTKDYQH